MIAATTHEKLQVHGPINFSHILGLSLSLRGNQHGRMKIQGYLLEESAPRDSIQELAGRNFCLLTPCDPLTNSLKPTFYGTACNFNVNRVGNVFLGETEIVGATALLDAEPRSRSFQNIDMTYRQVVEEILKDTPNASADFSTSADQAIQKPLIQYEETDWTFIKRLASMLGTQLIPDCTTPFPFFYFGQVPHGQGTLCADEYSHLLDKRFYELGSSECGLYKPDFMCYTARDVQYYNLGDQVSFNEQPLVICEQDGILENGEVLYTYKIGRPGWFFQREIKNEKLTGLSLVGTVERTERETIRVKLDIDEGRDAGSYPFSWTPESGNIMYCMPKIGTRVTLYIPSCDSGEAVIINSPRINGEDCKEMTNPQKRCFTTEYGKKMCLYPQQMILSGGMPNETLQIELNQLNYLLLLSTRSIQLVAKLDIEIAAPRILLNTPLELQTSRSPVHAQAKVSMIIPKGTGGGNPPTGGGETVLTMQYQFDALGASGVLCGTEFKDYPPFDDAPSEFNWSGWMANIVTGVIIAAVLVVAAIFTGGLLGAALMGAAMGVAAVTATIAMEDAADGEVRSWDTAIKQIGFGAAAGAAVGLTGAYIAPHGVAAMSTWIKFGMLSGATMRVATSNAMEHMDTLDRLWYTFNPTSVLTDGIFGGFLGGVSNYFKLGTAFPSQEMVNLYNTSQTALQATQAIRAVQESDDVSRLDEIEVKFDYKSKYDKEEFARQLADQQDGMNQLTVQEYLENRQNYITHGRSAEGGAAQVAARQDALIDKIAELRESGLSLADAESQAQKWLETQAALHTPDQVAGGFASRVNGVGDSGVNSSIGSQWRTRIGDVDAKIAELVKDMSLEERMSTYLNMRLTY